MFLNLSFVSLFSWFFIIYSLSSISKIDYKGFLVKKWNPFFLDFMLIMNLGIMIFLTYLAVIINPEKETFTFVVNFMVLIFAFISSFTFLIIRLNLRDRLKISGYEIKLVSIEEQIKSVRIEVPDI